MFFALLFHDQSVQKRLCDGFKGVQSYDENKDFIGKLRALMSKTPRVKDLVSFFNHPVIQLLWWNDRKDATSGFVHSDLFREKFDAIRADQQEKVKSYFTRNHIYGEL